MTISPPSAQRWKQLQDLSLQVWEKEDDNIEWRNLSEIKQIAVGSMDVKKEAEVLHEDIPWDSNPSEVNYNSNSVLFEEFVPSLKGKSKLHDEF